MGNKSSIPAPKQVYIAAKAGNLHDLQAISNRLREIGPDTPEQRADLLEWTDEDGRTPLVVAVAKNHRGVVALLLNLGANVQHVSRKKDGGSALHEAVQKQCSRDMVELLLRSGASPFVENSSGFTALDYAILRKELHLVRRFEEFGPFRGYLMAKVAHWGGLKKNYFPRWVAIVPRYPYPGLPGGEQVIRRLLIFYENAQHQDPTCRVYLDGSQAALERDSNHERVCTLTLHPTHPKPRGLYLKGSQNAGFSLFLKKCPNVGRGRENEFPSLDQFVSVVSLRQGNTSAGAPPGESDEQFALRLHSQLNPIPPAASQTNSGPSIASGPTLNQGSHSPQQAYPSISPSGYLDAVPSTEGSQGSSAPTTGSTLKPGLEPEQSAGLPSAPPLPEEYISPAPPLKGAQSGEAAAPAAPVDDLDDDDACVVCLAAPKEAGFVHGDSVHRCVCKQCAAELMQQEQKNCPVCRQKIDTVLTAFY